ncbi:MAG: aminopeptidase P family protein [Spirochaetales bacterium]|nr:aminopeptidase P family protein [Spirochaetales bacterium]
MRISQEKIDRIQKTVMDEGFDVLFTRLTVNALFLTGYWAGNDAVAVIFPSKGRPVLLVAETEYDNAAGEVDQTNLDIETYSFESLDELRGITNSMVVSALPGILKRMGVLKGVIGIEQSAEDGALPRLMGDFKYPSVPTWNTLKDTFPNAKFKDATSLINRLRMIKTSEEIDAIKKTITIACMGFDAARKAVKTGMTEAELSAVLEAEILGQGTGKNNVGYSRGFSSIYAGSRSATQWTHWACSTGRIIQENEMVIMELGSVSDGYWCDLTRHACAGKPSKKAREIMQIVLEAQHRGIAVAKPGVPVGEIDRTCHDYLAQKGYDREYFRHPCGHGVGFTYHEGPPVHQACNILLEQGMLLCVEPGVYLPGEFGIRTEDMILIKEGGAEVISDYPHAF